MALLGLFLSLTLGAAGRPATQPSLPALPGGTLPGAGALPGGALPAGATVAVVPIEGEIDDFTRISVKRRTDRALAAGASIIVYRFDTPGGGEYASLQIAQRIKQVKIPTVAWIKNTAYSGGSILATACGRIVMAKSAKIGDCAPILGNWSTMGATERAKALSPLLAEFKDNAQTNGYPYALLEGMCVYGVRIYEIRNPQSGKTLFVTWPDYAVMVEGKSVAQVNREQQSKGPVPVSSGGQLHLGLDRHGVGVPTVTALAIKAKPGQWQLVRQVHSGNSLVTLDDGAAKKLRLSSATVTTQKELAQYLGAKHVFMVPQTWSENLAEFLAGGMVRAVLLVIFLVGAFMEFHAPGLSLPGAVAVLALAGLLGAPLIMGLAAVWHIVLFVLGLIMLIIEILWIPGFGLLGAAGIICMFIGLVLSAIPTAGGPSFGPFQLPPPRLWDQVLISAVYMAVALVASAVALIMLANRFGGMPLFNRLILQDPPRPPLPAGEAAAVLPASGSAAVAHGRLALGEQGRVVSQLRPAGRAEFHGQFVDVVSLGQWIDVGRPVRIVEVRGNRIVVESY